MNGITKTIMVVLGIALMFGAVSAVAVNNGNSLKLVAKDPTTWKPIDGGAWGQFAGKSLNFNAYGLTPNTPYVLISYAEPWGSTNSILASGMSDAEGNLAIKGGSSFAASELIQNTYTSDEYAGQTGAKIWLVPYLDLTNGVINKWNPTAWLFETKLI